MRMFFFRLQMAFQEDWQDRIWSFGWHDIDILSGYAGHMVMSLPVSFQCVLSVRLTPFRLCRAGERSKRHVFNPATEDGEQDGKAPPPPPGGGEAADGDGVTALEWDPLSTDYLLLARGGGGVGEGAAAGGGVRLVDTESLTTITRFSLPSAAAAVRALSWIPSAPGMFATGGAIFTVASTVSICTLKIVCCEWSVSHTVEATNLVDLGSST